jgi:hypothetical protein
VHSRFPAVLAMVAFALTLLFAVAAGAQQESTIAEDLANSVGEQTVPVQSSRRVEAQDVQTQDQGCRDKRTVLSINSERESVNEKFDIDGDKFRVTYSVTFTNPNNNNDKFEVKIEEGSRKVKSSSAEQDVNNRSFTVNEGFGEFKLKTTVTGVKTYSLTVQDCRGDNSNNNNRHNNRNNNFFRDNNGRNNGGGNNRIHTGRTPSETTTSDTITRNTSPENTNPSSVAAETTTSDTAANADFANRPNSENFRCESFLRSFSDNRGALNEQYKGNEDIVRRFEECLSEDVLRNTIPNRNLPFTGGMSLLALAVIGLVALIAGIAVFRAVMRRMR